MIADRVAKDIVTDIFDLEVLAVLALNDTHFGVEGKSNAQISSLTTRSGQKVAGIEEVSKERILQFSYLMELCTLYTSATSGLKEQ